MWAARRVRGRAWHCGLTAIGRGETVTRVQADCGLSPGQASPGSRRDVRSGGGVAGLRVLVRVHACKLLTHLCRNVVHFSHRFPDQFCGQARSRSTELEYSPTPEQGNPSMRRGAPGFAVCAGLTGGTRCPALTVRREVVRSSTQKMVLTYGQRRAYGQVMTAAAAIGGERCLPPLPSPDLDSGGRGLEPGMSRSRCRKQDFGRRDDWWVVRRCCEGDEYGSTW